VPTVTRVQTGVRLERNTLRVLRALAEYLDMPLGELLEGIVLHAFEGASPFEPATVRVIEQLRGIYGLELRAADSHRLASDEAAPDDN
jgi:hypothetical protein